MTVITVVFLSK